MAKQGYTDGMVGTAVCVLEAIGPVGVTYTEQEEADITQWLFKAAAEGNPQAHYELGCCYYRGLGMEEDEVAAFQHFEKAAAAGHMSAQFLLGDCLLEGCGCEIDPHRAYREIYAAAEQGHRFARQKVRELVRDGYRPAPQ